MHSGKGRSLSSGIERDRLGGGRKGKRNAPSRPFFFASAPLFDATLIPLIYIDGGSNDIAFCAITVFIGNWHVIPIHLARGGRGKRSSIRWERIVI